MKRIFAIALAGAAMATVPAASAADAPSKGEQQLTKMIDGRVAGEPKDCIFLTGTSPNLTIIDKTAIVYRDGRTLWVNRPENPESLDDDDVLVTERFGSNYCRLDRTYTVERTGHFFSGAVFLGKFVPYRLPDNG